MDPLYLVRLAGIEPTTPWFVAKYSIQLSYSRERRDYSTAFGRNGSLCAKKLPYRARTHFQTHQSPPIQHLIAVLLLWMRQYLLIYASSAL
jgi:hypothetical protein